MPGGSSFANPQYGRELRRVLRDSLSDRVSLPAVTLCPQAGGSPRLLRFGGSRSLHQAKHLTRLGVAPDRLLGEDPTSIHFHLEHATGGLDQLHIGVRVNLADLGRQTGGPRLVVSDDAVFDRDSHA